MERMQRTLLLILPLVFLFFILNFPAGLVLYWVTTNLWTTGQGLITRRLTQKKPEAQPKRSSRTPPREEVEPADDEAAPAPVQPQKPAVRKVKRKKKKKKARR
jgi:YidC/Oxa1 family membrane protein insertase